MLQNENDITIGISVTNAIPTHQALKRSRICRIERKSEKVKKRRDKTGPTADVEGERSRKNV